MLLLFSHSGVLYSLYDYMNCSTPDFPALHYLPVCSNSCPLSQWYVIPFFSCPQSFPESGSFLMNRLFASHGKNTGADICIKNPQNYILSKRNQSEKTISSSILFLWLQKLNMERWGNDCLRLELELETKNPVLVMEMS